MNWAFTSTAVHWAWRCSSRTLWQISKITTNWQMVRRVINFLRLWNKVTASNVDEAQLGLIGETYVGSLGTLHYCSDNKLVPVEWPSTAPTGFGSFLAFSGMHANNIRPHLLRISDTVSTDKTPRTIQKADSQTGITYFACEPLVLMVTSGN